ncbi:MAG: ATP synthase epsilon chain [Candidatus Omnitrophica bacterium]|nr:ATP synthase epsilon chain [Candidatus Omnitrophota bacterium]
MADAPITLKVITPDEVFYEGRVQSVVAPGTLGYLGILRDHAPLVTTIGAGDLTYRDAEGRTQGFRIEGGFLEVQNNRVLVLTDRVDRNAE